MVTLSWLRFQWDVEKLPAEELDVPSPFVLRRAESEDQEAVLKAITNAFSMDTGWSDIQRMFGEIIVRHVHAGFSADPPDSVVIQHGSRIIAGSILNSKAEAEDHLTTGPCVLQEYRGRGLGTVLLQASLAALREAGVSRAYGVTRDKSTAARFLYPKFGGSALRWTPDFEVAQKIAA
ncbi:MAG TPA: GNAT family N-acetyltransferase [Terrimicrobiaceae bacterium]